jgi:hypothetical protein
LTKEHISAKIALTLKRKELRACENTLKVKKKEESDAQIALEEKTKEHLAAKNDLTRQSEELPAAENALD